MKAISVFGLGKVGTALCASLLERGYSVIGYDPLSELVDSLTRGTFQTSEPRVSAVLAAHRERFRCTKDAADATLHTEATFIIVPTPSNSQGGFSSRYVLDAVTSIGKALRSKSTRHCVSIVSTVVPGASREEIIPTLERAAGKTIGETLGFAYNPAFIALGEIMKGFLEPAFVLIGEADPASGQELESLHKVLTNNASPIVRMTPTEAEITKLASNTYETTRVSFVNMLLNLCDRLPDTNVDHITQALTHRFAKRLFRGAVPYGGPCWPRDNIALAKVLDTVGVPSELPKAVDAFNQSHTEKIVRDVLAIAKPEESIGIVGLAYKPGTPHLDVAFGVNLVRCFLKAERRLFLWDPMVPRESMQELAGATSALPSLAGLLKSCDAIVLAQPVPELADADWSLAKNACVIDPWRVLTSAQRQQVGRYIPLGAAAPELANKNWAEHRAGLLEIMR